MPLTQSCRWDDRQSPGFPALFTLALIVLGSSAFAASATLPSPWQHQDIGAVGLAGDATCAGGVFTIKASGDDIWNAADAFHFVYQPLAGDGAIVARVTSVQNTDPWAKAGVMIRETLNANSMFALMILAGNGLSFQDRPTTGGACSYTGPVPTPAPAWVKLVRSGNTFSAFSSLNGTSWTSVGSATINMTGSVYIGVAVTAHNNTALNTSTLDNVTATVGTTPPPANQAPTVSLTSPANNATFTASTSITITASAADSDGTISKVEFFNGATLLGTSTTSPYNFAWSSVAAGSYSLTAKATDNSGASTTSVAVNITVSTAPTPPPPSGGGTGTILREWWTGIGAIAISNLTSDLRYPNSPTGSNYPTSFEAPTDWADNYGTRMRGYLYPPTTGAYTFWLASDNCGELWLSTDVNPANKVRIATVSSWTPSRAWDTFAEQKSATITLVAGQQYYIEALQKEADGGDNLAVAWQGPGLARAVIAGQYLSPYTGSIAPPPSATITVNAGMSQTAIQTAIDGSAAGDTISFQAGGYNLTAPLTFKSNQTYLGQTGAVLNWKGTGQDFSVQTEWNGQNITINGLTFNGSTTGGGLRIDGTGTAKNITVTNCTIQNITSNVYASNNGIFVVGVTGLQITNNHFSNIAGDTAIMGQSTLSNATITGNHFDGCWGDCIHLMFNDVNATNVVIARNTGVNLYRMGIEIQGYPNTTQCSIGMLIEDNDFSQYQRRYAPGTTIPNTGSYDGYDPDTFGLSIMDGGTGTIIRNNRLVGQKGCAWGCELGIKNGDVYGNYIENFSVGFAAGMDFNTKVHDNTLVACAQPILDNYLNRSDTSTTYSNNTILATPPAANQAPVITAAASATPNPVTLPATASLSVTASDDGLPNPPHALTYTWSKVSGTGTVAFAPNGTAASATSTATFSAAGAYVLRVTVSDSALSANSDVTVNVSAPAPPPSGTLPSPWQHQDIGTVGYAGDATCAGGVFTVKASGADIWNAADAFHFVYQPLTGDGTIVARVTSVQNTDSWAKAGVMIRETLNANSTYAIMILSAGSGLSFQNRLATAGSCNYTAPVPATAPTWVKLVRSGNTFNAFSSANGSTWTSVGSVTIAMTASVNVGLAVTAHNNNALNTSTLDNVTVTVGTAPPLANQPPTVALTAPANGATYTGPANITLTASAADSDGTIAKVEFYNGATLLGTDATSPYSFTWANVAAGNYSLTAKATDNSGASTTSAVVNITVNAVANQPPTVSLTAPANGANYTGPANITLTASAGDSDGTIAKVEFYNGATLLGTATASPYSFTWANVAAGTCMLTAKATDNAGASTTSAVVTVTIIAAPVAGGGSGKILREWWRGISGSSIINLTSDPNYPDGPTGSDYPTSFEAPSNWAADYGTRMRGFLYPPTTGSYTFWIATDDAGELWLSTDDNPANRARIATVSTWAAPRAWDTYPEQKSVAINLVAGRAYYIEALQKQGGGGDHLAVAWQGPGLVRDVIAGQYLSPIATVSSLPQDPAYDQRLRPQFHFTAKTNWLNDPNGCVYYNGEYHLFFQRNPFSLQWGSMTWGHAVSTDLVHWQQLADAITPYGGGDVWSGSAVVDANNLSGFKQGSESPLVAAFTHAKSPYGQCLAFSNDKGRTWTLYNNGDPVVSNQGLNNEERDPNIFWHAASQKWVMAIWAGNRIRFFNSTNLKQWTFASDFFCSAYECPDIYELAVDGNQQNRKWVLQDASLFYWIGSFDGTQFVPEAGPIKGEFGTNFYAAQTWNNTGSRVVQIAWMREFGVAYPDMPFNQQMTFPCELSLRTTAQGIRLCRNPISEIQNIRIGDDSVTNQTVNAGDTFTVGSGGDLLDIEAEVEVPADGSGSFAIRMYGYDYVSYIGGVAHCLGGQATMAPVGNVVKLRVLVDRASMELFGNDGQVSISGLFLPDRTQRSTTVQFRAGTGALKVRSLVVHRLKSIWDLRVMSSYAG